MADYLPQKTITIDDIARELGVSKSTVSRALSGKGRIGEDTRNRIIRFSEQHNYTPNLLAKGLAQSKTFNIGVVIPTGADLMQFSFFMKCLTGICEAASARDYEVVLVAADNDDLGKIKRVVKNRKVDGIILTRVFDNDKAAAYLKQQGLPFSVIGYLEDGEICQVDYDQITACRELTGIICSLGKEHIGLIGGDHRIKVNRKYYEGYLEGLKDWGIQVQAEMVFMDVRKDQEIRNALVQLLARGADTIVCMDDYICKCVLENILEMDVNIQEKIRVASFYYSEIVEVYRKNVMSIYYDPVEAGQTVCNQLIDCQDGKLKNRSIQLGYKIIKNRTK